MVDSGGNRGRRWKATDDGGLRQTAVEGDGRRRTVTEYRVVVKAYQIIIP